MTTRLSRLKRILYPCVLFSVFLAPASHAIDYDVEIIIFEHVRDTSVGSSDTLLFPVLRNVERIPDGAIAGEPVQPVGELRLQTEAAKIRSSNNHRLLYHGGWRQGEVDEESAPFMAVALGGQFDLLTEQAEEDSLYLRGYRTPPVDTPLALNPRRSTRLFGGIKVWVGRFLHFETRLAYTPANSDSSFAFESDRRLRSRQLHYIDHPRVGIITKIFPVDDTAPN